MLTDVLQEFNNDGVGIEIVEKVQLIMRAGTGTCPYRIGLILDVGRHGDLPLQEIF